MRRNLRWFLPFLLALVSCSGEKSASVAPPPAVRPDTLDPAALAGEIADGLLAEAAGPPVVGAVLEAASCRGEAPPPELLARAESLVAGLPPDAPPSVVLDYMPLLLAWERTTGEAEALLHSPDTAAALSAAGEGGSLVERAEALYYAACVEGFSSGRGVAAPAESARRLLDGWLEEGVVTPWGMVAADGLSRSPRAAAAVTLVALAAGDWDAVAAFTRNHLVETLSTASGDEAAFGVLALCAVARAAVTERDGAVTVNLVMNASAPFVEVNSFLPEKGCVDVYMPRGGELRLRYAAWTTPADVLATINGIPAEPEVVGDYWRFWGLRPGDRVGILFTPHPRWGGAR